MIASKNTFVLCMLAQAFAWLIFSVVSFFYQNASILLFSLMATNGFCFSASVVMIDARKIFKIGIFLFLFVNLVLTVTDQMGLYDYFVLVLNIVSTISLIIYYSHIGKEQVQDE